MSLRSVLSLQNLAFVFLITILYSCASSFNQQSSTCLNEYSAKINACNGNEECETDAVNTFQSCIGYEYVFPVNFVVLTDSVGENRSEVTSELNAVIDSLNKYFTVQDNSLPPDNRRRVVTFRFESATYFSEAIAFGGELVDSTQPNFNFDTRHGFKEFVNDPANDQIVADDAINIFIVDCWGTKNGTFKDISDSHAKNNNDHPYIVLDYARITGKAKRSGVEEHETGHCFGLAHVCVAGSTPTTSTNIMATTGSYPKNNNYEYNSSDAEGNCGDDNPGNTSVGLRDIGFNASQCVIIMRNAQDIATALGL